MGIPRFANSRAVPSVVVCFSDAGIMAYSFSSVFSLAPVASPSAAITVCFESFQGQSCQLFHRFAAASERCFGLGPRFSLPALALFSSASISFRSDFETRKTFRSALSNIAALGRLAFGLAIFSAYNTPVGRRRRPTPTDLRPNAKRLSATMICSAVASKSPWIRVQEPTPDDPALKRPPRLRNGVAILGNISISFLG